MPKWFTLILVTALLTFTPIFLSSGPATTSQTSQINLLPMSFNLKKMINSADKLYKKYKGTSFRAQVPDYLERRSLNFHVAPLKKLHGFKDHLINLKLLQGIAAVYPDKAQLYTIGDTTQGQPIPALLLTSAPKDEQHHKPSVLVNCAHHPGELLSMTYCYRVISTLLKEENSSSLKRFRFWVIPVVNPDGLARFWHMNYSCLRKNTAVTVSKAKSGKWPCFDGVDLNRNYPFKWGGSSTQTKKWSGSSGAPEKQKYPDYTPPEM